ncbi:MAG: hypothetical protein JWP78_2357 [Mucilaginibacter sp.]|nr:hypothetical protein [Mucilaginibacter sp.]
MKSIKKHLPIIVLLLFISFVKANVTGHYKIHKKNEIDTLVVNVRAYGALGNGTQDDYNAISQALSASQTPVKILFPAGNYLISKPLITTHEGIVFLFEKDAQIVIPDNKTGGIVLRNNNCSVINAHISGNGQSATLIKEGFGILLAGVSNCKVLNCSFKQISGINILLINQGKQGCSNCVINGNNISYPAFNRNIIQDASGIMLGYSGTGYFHTNNLISNNIIDANQTLAHGIALITHGMNNSIIKNHVKNCLRYGIVSYESNYENYTLMRTNIFHNVIENIGNPNGKSSPYGMGIYLMSSHNSIVKGNKVTNCLINTDNSETLPSGAIALNGSTFCTIDSNIVNYSHRYGIVCSMSFNSKITNNLIDSTSESGIYLINTNGNLIKNNVIRNVGNLSIKGFFESTAKPNLSANMTLKKYKNLSTGQGIEITKNKIYSNSAHIIYMTGEDADVKSNNPGNEIKSISIHDNTFIGNTDVTSIQLNKTKGTLNKVTHNEFKNQ